MYDITECDDLPAGIDLIVDESGVRGQIFVRAGLAVATLATTQSPYLLLLRRLLAQHIH